jgi:precorrin-6B methylase 2
VELAKERVLFGDSAAVKICADLDSAPPERTLNANTALAARIEEFRSSGQAWGVITRPSLGLEDSGRDRRESWSLRGARSRLRSVGFSAAMSAPVAFSMKTEAASQGDAAILADELRVFLRDASASGQAELKPIAAQAQVREAKETVRLGLELPMTGIKLLKGSRTARSVFTWELGALARENRQRIPEIFQHLGLQKGSKVADVGAGGGFFTVRLARAVGPEGRIWAVDIVPQIVESLRQRTRESRLDNVEVVPGEAANPKLPEAALDAVLIVNSYHEMPHYSEILEHLSRALRPGGRLVVSEPFSVKRRNLPRAEQIKEHEIAPELIEQELRSAGFEIVFRDDKFIENRESGMDSILVARRPK